MPLLDPTLQRHSLNSSTSPGTPGGTFGFSATRLDALEAAEFTLTAIAVDNSSSVHGFIREIEACVGAVVEACGRSARVDNLMLRVLRFTESLDEVHGFKPLAGIDAGDYAKSMKAHGCTALYDATCNAVASVADYGGQLADHDFEVNGIVFVITDGADNSSSADPAAVRKAFGDIVRAEKLDSFTSVLIGVGVNDAGTRKTLAAYAKDAGFTDFIDAGAATPSTLAKLAQFVSQSIALQSQALGSGSAASLTF